MNRTRSTVALAFALTTLGSPMAATAEGFPARPVRIVVPSSVGGGADAVARLIAADLAQTWSKGVSVENKPGAGGAIGSLEVVRAQPDGYTLVVQNSTMVTNDATATRKPYDPSRDLTPIMLLGVTPLAVFAHSGAPFASLAEMIAATRARSGPLSYASCGNGTPHHFAMELLKLRTGIHMQHVSYKGCAPAITDVLGGQLAVGVATANMVVPHVASGRVKVLAVSGAKRYRPLPDAPTLESLGHGAPDFSVWYALMGPAKMAPQRVAEIAKAVGKALDKPQVQAQLSAAGVEPIKGDADELARLIHAQTELYGRIAREANIEPN